MKKTKEKVVDITNMSEELIINNFVVEQEEYRRSLRIRFAGFVVLLLTFATGFTYFHLVAIPEMVKSWFGIN